MREKPKIITADYIMQITSGGKEVFERELGKVTNKHIKSPLRNDGDTPSFLIKQSSTSALWLFCDYGGSQDFGNCITFISKLYNLTYQQAIEKIASDFGLYNKNVNYKKEIIENDVIKKIKKPDLWEYSIKKFEDNHKKYMDKYELDEKFLNNNDVFALKAFSINKKIQTVKGETHSFVYVHKDEHGKETGGIKMLRLGNVDKKLKWRTNVFNSKLWFTHTIPENCENLFIVKSVKDVLCLKKHFNLNAVATQNESSNILLENNYDYLHNISKNKIISFGTDFQGWHESLIITTVTGWNYWNTPNHLYDKYAIEDISDYIAKYGVESLKVLLKNKKYL